MTTQDNKAERFRALHRGEPFVIPNPWDVGSARVLEALGFDALATTSSGFAFTLGRLDSSVTLNELTTHVAALDEAIDLPISVDLENGYGPDPEEAAEAIRRAAGAGAVGGSIEDWDPKGGGRLYDLGHAVERVAAAVEASEGLDFDFTLTARAENHIRGHPHLDDTIARLQAYENAGADVIYAPGLDLEQVAQVRAATTRPINVLARSAMSVAEIGDAGGQRISLGGGLAWVGVAAIAAAAERIRTDGDLSALDVSIPLAEWLGR